MYPIPLRLLLGTGILAGEVYAGTEVHRLYTNYAWEDRTFTGPVAASFPAGLTGGGRVRATITNPPKAALANPLDTYLSAFYSTWTLRLEGWCARRFGWSPQLPEDVTPTGETFASGVFRGVYRDENQVAVFWRWNQATKDKWSLYGVQVLEAQVNDETGEMEIFFGGAEIQPPPGKSMSPITTAFHYMYCRFLVDRAKKTLEKWAREGK